MSGALAHSVAWRLFSPAWPEAGHLWSAFRIALRRGRTRRRLVDLDAHELKDIGISRADAEAEANKPFWEA